MARNRDREREREHQGKHVKKQDALITRPIPHAYALVRDPQRGGRYFAVHLTDVVAGGIDYLETSSRAEAAPYGLRRITTAMETRHRRKDWGGDDETPGQPAPQEAQP